MTLGNANETFGFGPKPAWLRLCKYNVELYAKLNHQRKSNGSSSVSETDSLPNKEPAEGPFSWRECDTVQLILCYLTPTWTSKQRAGSKWTGDSSLWSMKHRRVTARGLCVWPSGCPEGWCDDLLLTIDDRLQRVCDKPIEPCDTARTDFSLDFFLSAWHFLK